MFRYKKIAEERLTTMLPSEFVACTNHSLNLAFLHAACTAIDFLTFFGTIEKLFSFFKFFHASMGC